MADKVFIITDGEFVCTKQAVTQMKDNNNIKEIINDPQRAGKMNNQYFTKSNAKKIENHFISFMYVGKMLGETDILSTYKGEGTGKYTTSIKCNSPTGKLIFIRKAEFLKL